MELACLIQKLVLVVEVSKPPDVLSFWRMIKNMNIDRPKRILLDMNNITSVYSWVIKGSSDWSTAVGTHICDLTQSTKRVLACASEKNGNKTFWKLKLLHLRCQSLYKLFYPEVLCELHQPLSVTFLRMVLTNGSFGLWSSLQTGGERRN